MMGYILTIRDTDLEKDFIKNPVDFKRRFHRVFVSHILGSSGDEKNCFALRLLTEGKVVVYGLQTIF